MKVCAWPNVAEDNRLVQMTQLNVTVPVHLQWQMNPNLHHHLKFGYQPCPVGRACVSANGSDVYFEAERSLPKRARNSEK